MQIEDLETIHELETKIFPDPWSLASFKSEIGNSSLSYPCVIDENGTLLGYAVVWFYSGEIHIGNIAITPEYRKKGLGKLLLEHILHKFNDYEMAFLEVRRSNLPAINLYKKFGFKELYIREFYYSNGEDAIVMGKKITKQRGYKNGLV